MANWQTLGTVYIADQYALAAMLEHQLTYWKMGRRNAIRRLHGNKWINDMSLTGAYYVHTRAKGKWKGQHGGGSLNCSAQSPQVENLGDR